MKGLFDFTHHRWWGTLVLSTLLWHGWSTAMDSGAADLFFICYSASLLLGVGLWTRNALLACAGAGWMLAGLPLWLYDAAASGEWGASCTLFHFTGATVGLLALGSYRAPPRLWLFAVFVGGLLTLAARLFTPPALNINAAFAVYRGWETLYPNHALFLLASVVGFSAYFMLLTRLNGAALDRIGGRDSGGQ